MPKCPACSSLSHDSVCPECGLRFATVAPPSLPSGDRYGTAHAIAIAAGWQALPVGILVWGVGNRTECVVAGIALLLVPVLTAVFHGCKRVQLFVWAIPIWVYCMHAIIDSTASMSLQDWESALRH